jgi:hypothetical protein
MIGAGSWVTTQYGNGVVRYRRGNTLTVRLFNTHQVVTITIEELS